MTKPKIAFYWCASCGGCEEAVVDLAEDILGVVSEVEIVLWPVAMDFKKVDFAAIPDRSVFATFLNGAIRSTEQEEWAHLLRRKSQFLIAYGSCACHGGVPGLANQFSREQLLAFAYGSAPTVSNPANSRPQPRTAIDGDTLELPALTDVVRTVDQVIPVDYYLPGCPPTSALTLAAIKTLLSGQLPPPGAVLAPDTALCEECPRRETKPTDLSIAAIKRPHEVMIDSEKCLLAQGVVCLGPATRSGCAAACPMGNMPCTGCSGPTSRVRDFGAKVVSSLAASVTAREGPEIEHALAGIPDPVGTFYRYGLPQSLLRRHVDLPANSSAPAK